MSITLHLAGIPLWPLHLVGALLCALTILGGVCIAKYSVDRSWSARVSVLRFGAYCVLGAYIGTVGWALLTASAS